MHQHFLLAARMLEKVWHARVALLSIAFVALLIASISLPLRDVIFADERDYVTIARTLLETGTFGYPPGQPSAARPPGYVLFITPFLTSGFGTHAVMFAQLLLWALNAYLAGRLALRLRGPAAAGAAMLIALGFPIFAYVALTIYPQTLTATLLLLFLLLLFDRPPEAKAMRRIGLVGLTGGLLVLVTPPTALVLASVIGLLWLLRVLSLRAAVLTAVIATLVLVPWLVRNHFIMGQAVITSNSGLNLFVGNSEEARAGRAVTLVTTPARFAEIEGLGELERDAHFRKMAIEWASENPGAAFQLYLGKLLQFFNFREEYATERAGGPWAERVMLVTYYPILLLAFANLLLARTTHLSKQEVVLLFAYLCAAAVYAIFFTRIRFRVPFDYLLVIMAGIAIDKLLTPSTKWRDADERGRAGTKI